MDFYKHKEFIMKLDDLVVSLNSLYEDFKKVPDDEVIKKYSFPFPIAVFGTLRKIPQSCGNTRRMYQVSEPIHHSKAILPHIAPIGLHVDFIKGAAGVGEVYFYNPEVWSKVIVPIDNLEGFSPGRGGYGYLRTLIKVYLLPDDFANDEFNRGISFGYSSNISYEHRNRDAHRVMPVKEWDKFPFVHAWIYSNNSCNEDINKNLTVDANPILWVE